MLPRKLTISTARDMSFEDLVQTADAILEQYAAPAEGGKMEMQQEQLDRLSRTIDEMPDIYRWFLMLQSYFDHWTDAEGDMWGTRSIEFKMMRQRRDLMDRMASAAKRRYEGASRTITVIEGFDESGLPRSRSKQE